MIKVTDIMMNCSIMNCKAKPKMGIRRIEDEGRSVNYSVYCPTHANLILYRCPRYKGEKLEKVSITNLAVIDGRICIQSTCDKQGSPQSRTTGWE